MISLAAPNQPQGTPENSASYSRTKSNQADKPKLPLLLINAELKPVLLTSNEE